MSIQQNIFNSTFYGTGPKNITSVQHTNMYAPGVATYGIRGIQGKTGNNGNSIFYTDLIIDTSYENFISKVASKRSVLSWKDTINNRPYQNGDIFIDKYSYIYELIDIQQLLIDNRNGIINSSSDVSSYFNKLGRIENINSSCLTNLDNIRENKLIISNIDSSTIKSTEYTSLLTLISKPNNNVTDFIDLNAIYNGIPDINLSVYFDNNTKAFHIDSSYPIYIDAPVSVKYDTSNIKSDIYSPIQIQENSITTYMSCCNDINVSIDSSIFDYVKNDSSTIYYGAIYTIEFTPKNTSLIDEKLSIINTDLTKFMIHFQDGMYQDFQCMRNGVNTYRFKRNYDYVKKSDAIHDVYFNVIKNIQISLIYNIEVFLNITNREMSGVDFGTYDTSK